MSDSGDEVSVTNDSKIELTLRAIITRIYKSGKHESLTLKRVRKAAEEEMGLPEGFFKQSDEWNKKSKTIIVEEVAKHDNDEPPSSPAKPTKPLKAAPAKSNGKARAAPRKAESAKRSTKRPTPGTKTKSQKKRKVVVSESEDEESTLSSLPSGTSEDDDTLEEDVAKSAPKEASKPCAKRVAKSPEAKRPQPASRNSGKVVDSDQEMKDASSAPKPKVVEAPHLKEQEKEDDDEANDEPAPEKEASPPAEAEASESEMSILIDEEPFPKKKRQKKDPTTTTTTNSLKSKTSKPPTMTKSKKNSLSPNEEETKRLQSYLLKCGIRKLWHKELAPYPSDKAKISHLKDMLKNAGMEGRFSEAKAKEIKERRELEADMEATKEYEAKFGAQEDKGRRMKGPADWGIDEDLLGSGGDDSD